MTMPAREHALLAALPTLAHQAPTPRPAVLAQRSSTFGGGSAAAPHILDAGRPLDSATRGAMESSFGRDFSNISVHDDARAHDSARALGSLAYTTGDHIVFGAGMYQPDTGAGQALIAHELAHSLQQGGVQLKAEGPGSAGADANLEAQANRAALDATAGRRVGAISQARRAAILRAPDPPPVSPEAKTPKPAGSTPDLPSDVTVVEEIPEGPQAMHLVVEVPQLTLPSPKGAGPWVQAGYSAMAEGKRLSFTPIFDGKSFDNAESIKAFKEPAGEKYRDIWLNNYGFKTLAEMADAFKTAAAGDSKVKTITDEPGVKHILDGFGKNRLTAAGTDIDHVVEKQLGGTSVPGNLQLLIASKNRPAGTNTYATLIGETRRILDPARPRVKKFQIRFRAAKVAEDSEDPSFQIESLLRTPNTIKGSDAVKSAGEGTPVQLVAGGASEVTRVRASGATPIDVSARRLVNGLKLESYQRGRGSSPTKGQDAVEAELAASVLKPLGKNVSLIAKLVPKPPDGEPAAGISAQEKAAAAEVRQLSIDKSSYKDVAFYYPYLSRGRITALELDDQRNVQGEGVITPSVRFLGDLKVRFGPDRLDLVQDVNVDQINASPVIKPVASVFRFTSGSVSIDLVKFKPSGTLEFEVGPRNKPVILGNVRATAEAGAFVATGELKPAGTIPGVTAAKGSVTYRSDTGWSGLLEATSTSIPNATTTVKLGFREVNGRIRPFGGGAITTTVRGAKLDLNVDWDGEAVAYKGQVEVKDPLPPFVESVVLRGVYRNQTLLLTGKADIKWKSIKSSMDVTYRRVDGDPEGKFSGKATVQIKTEKALGSIDLSFDEEGRYWGKGTVGYQVTKDVRPTLGVELTKDRKLKMSGEVRVADIPLTRQWPQGGGNITFIKGAGVKFPVPLPVPGINAFGEIRVSAGLRYGVGPIVVRGILFVGELYPLEDDPQIKADLKGQFAVPAYAELYGKFGARIGVEVAGGLVGAKGGIDLVPALRIQGEGGANFSAAYEAGAFAFAAEAYAEGQLILKLGIDLLAEIYAGYGLWSHTWTWSVANFQKPLGPKLHLTLGRIAYEKGQMTWPSLDQVKLDPENIDPMQIITDLLETGKDAGSVREA